MEDNLDAHSKMIDACITKRGTILSNAIFLEDTMNFFLAMHYCEENNKNN